MVLHHCDNPPCVRPDHLFEGDAKDNALDLKSKGLPMGGGYGHIDPRRKLTFKQAEEIRKKYKQGATYEDLVKEYNYNAGGIWYILKNITYKK